MRPLCGLLAVAACAWLASGARQAGAQAGPADVTATVVSRLATPEALPPGLSPAQETATSAATAAAATATPTAPVPTATVPTAPGPTATPGAPGASSTPSPTAPVVPLQRPILVLLESHVEPGAPGPGSEIAVRLEVRNVGTVDAENVQLTVSSPVFRAGSGGSTLYKEEIDTGETRPFDLRLQVDSVATAGVHALEIGLRWEDAFGQVYTDQTSIGIQVFASPTTRPQLVVVESSVPGRVVPGAPFDIVLQVRNGGGSEARNVVLTTSGGALAPRGASEPTALAPGASATLTLRVVAANAAEPGAVTQLLELRYSDPDGLTYVDGVSVGLIVSGDDMLGPLPLVMRYEFGGPLAPGQVFELVLDIENVGPTDALRTRLVLGSNVGGAGLSGSAGGGLGVFAPLGTGNVRFLGRLAAGAGRTLTQRMVVDGAAKPGVYVLEVGFEYTDPDGRPQTSSGVISLLVSRPVRIEINPVEVVDSAVVGASMPFAVEIVNAGDAKVNVGNAEVRGDRRVDVLDGTVFVGPLDAGSYFSVDATLVPLSPGAARVTVVVKYIDDFNQERTFEASFPLDVEEEQDRPERELVEAAPPAPVWLRVIKGFLGLGASAISEAPAPEIGEAATGGRHEIRVEDDAEPVRSEAAETVTP